MLDAGSAGVVGTADVEGMLDAGSSAGVAWAAGVEGKAETFNVQRSTFNVIPPPSQHHRHYQHQHRASLKVETAITTPPALPASSIQHRASSIEYPVSSIQYHSLANRRPNSTGPPSPHLLITYYALRFTILCNSR
jgi:hypothetical protein